MKIGLQELLVVFIVALVVIGPDKLPYYAKKLGQAFGQFRKYTEEATKDIRESVVEPLNEAQKPLREAMAPVTELEKDVRKNVNEIRKSISDIGKPMDDKKDSEKSDAAAGLSGQDISGEDSALSQTAAAPLDSAEAISETESI